MLYNHKQTQFSMSYERNKHFIEDFVMSSSASGRIFSRVKEGSR